MSTEPITLIFVLCLSAMAGYEQTLPTGAFSRQRLRTLLLTEDFQVEALFRTH
jgi:hypothetical protein